MFDRVLALFRGSPTSPTVGTGVLGTPVVPLADLGGVIWVRLSSGTGPTTAAVDAGPSALDVLPSNTFVGLDTRSVLYGLNDIQFAGTTFDRLRVIPSNIDAQVAAQLGLLGVSSRPQFFNGVTFDRSRSLVDNADAAAAGVIGLQGIINRNQLFNGITYDRERGNTDITVLASAVRAATNQSADITNFNARGLQLVFDITAVPGVDTVSLTIQGKDTLSGNYYTILTGAAQIGVATVIMRVYPALTALANLTANDILPRTWRVNVAHSGAGNFTYSVGASVIL